VISEVPEKPIRGDGSLIDLPSVRQYGFQERRQVLGEHMSNAIPGENMSLSAFDLVAEAKSQITEIEPAVARDAIHDALVLDVREPAEYEAGRLPGAINIPRGVLEFRIGDHPQFTRRDQDILVYCKTSGRAALAALNLKRMGYDRVRSIHGGFDAWSQGGLPVEQESTRFGD
jgi:rhodanese-related sulfurtransferase